MTFPAIKKVQLCFISWIWVLKGITEKILNINHAFFEDFKGAVIVFPPFPLILQKPGKLVDHAENIW